MILTYVRKYPPGSYYDHEIRYPNGRLDARTNDGFVFRNPSMRMEMEHDVVEILPLEQSPNQKPI